ncbi:MAG: type I methionyl aminopeptidase [Arsenophonus sp.]|nr:MAG: type I methionyl aminopeptidase [Arsenophonus sp.]
MTVFIKSKEEIEKMRISGKLAAEVLEMIEPYIKIGISTEEINDICHQYIINEQKAIPACLNYHGFPKSICTSVNDVVCHGIPNKKVILKNKDIINIDVTIIKNGFYGDTSKMFIVGEKTNKTKKICKIAQKSLYLALKIIKPGIKLNAIGETIQKFVENHKYSVVREYCGHGIGKKFHEEPQILHYQSNDNQLILKKGMTFTIEPMINAGHHNVFLMKDGWTVKTQDHSLSAQYEHTLGVTKYGCEIFTIRKEEIPYISPKLFNL